MSLWKKLCESRALFLMNQNSDPLKLFVPLLLTRLIWLALNLPTVTGGPNSPNRGVWGYTVNNGA